MFITIINFGDLWIFVTRYYIYISCISVSCPNKSIDMFPSWSSISPLIFVCILAAAGPIVIFHQFASLLVILPWCHSLQLLQFHPSWFRSKSVWFVGVVAPVLLVVLLAIVVVVMRICSTLALLPPSILVSAIMLAIAPIAIVVAVVSPTVIIFVVLTSTSPAPAWSTIVVVSMPSVVVGIVAVSHWVVIDAVTIAAVLLEGMIIMLLGKLLVLLLWWGTGDSCEQFVGWGMVEQLLQRPFVALGVVLCWVQQAVVGKLGSLSPSEFFWTVLHDWIGRSH